MQTPFLVILLTACGGGVTLEREAAQQQQAQTTTHAHTPTADGTTAAASAMRNAHLKRLSSSSGSPQHLFDVDPTTAWEPKGQALAEWVDATFATAVAVSELRFVSCRMGAQAKVWVDLQMTGGTTRHAVSISSDQIVGLPVAGDLHGLRLSVGDSPGRACISELQLRFGEASYPVIPPRYRRGTATATTTHEPIEAWSAMYLFDHRLHRGWSAPNKGIGERVSVSLEVPTALMRFELHNGYQRSERHFLDNTRARRVRMSADKGPWLEMEFRDMPGAQVVELPAPVPGSQFEFSFESAYPGEKWEDLVLSELRLSDREGWFGIEAPRDVAQERVRSREAGKTSLKEMVDRPWVSVCQEGRAEAGALRIRSTGEVTWLQADGAWLDGAWSLADSDTEKSTFELYGRWSEPEASTGKRSGGMVTAQDARSMTGGQISAWLGSAPTEVSACLDGNKAEQIASQGAMLVSGPVYDVLVPFQATQAL